MCSKGELKTIARHAETVRLEPGVALTRQGAEGDAFYVILDGQASVDIDGEEVNRLDTVLQWNYHSGGADAGRDIAAGLRQIP